MQMEQCGQWPGESGESSSIHVPAREMSVVTGVGGACAELLKVLEGMGCCSKTSLSICATRDVCPLQPPHSLSLLCPFHPQSFRLLCWTWLLEADPKNLPHPGSAVLFIAGWNGGRPQRETGSRKRDTQSLSPKSSV